MSAEVHTSRRIYQGPVVLGIATFIGLITALLGDGTWDELSWVILVIPLTVILWSVCRKR